MTDLAPKEIGGFRILRRLASGATSDVLLARAEGPHGFQRVVALKILLGRPRGDAEFDRSFAAQASAYARLSHPAVVKLYDFFSAEGQLVLVLEYVDGVPLHKLRAMLAISGERIDDKAALFLGFRVFSALAAAHAARDPVSGAVSPIVHYDVNPSNILVPWDGQVKLGDFGIAHAAGVQPDARTGFIKGTYGYAAPEQVSAQGGDARADVYSAGLILWELLARRKAVQRGTLNDAQVHKAMAHPEFPALELLRPDLDANVRTAVRRALEPDRAKRDVTAEDIVNVLRQVVSADDGGKALAAAVAKVRSDGPDGGETVKDKVARREDTHEKVDPEETAPFEALTEDGADLGKIAFYGRIMLPGDSAPPARPAASGPPAATLPPTANVSPSSPVGPPRTGVVSAAATAGGSAPPRPVPRPGGDRKPLLVATPQGAIEPEPSPPSPPAEGTAPPPDGAVPTASAEPPVAHAAPEAAPTVPLLADTAPRAEEPPVPPSPVPPPPVPPPPVPTPAAVESAPSPRTERSPEASADVSPALAEERPRSSSPDAANKPKSPRYDAPPFVPSSLPPPPPKAGGAAKWVGGLLLLAGLGGGVTLYMRFGPDEPVGTPDLHTTGGIASASAQHATAAPVAAPAASSARHAVAPSSSSSASTSSAMTVSSSAAAVASAAAAVASATAASRPSPAAGASSPPATAASIAPAAGPIPADTGEIELPASAAGHRIFVDGKVAGEGAAPVRVRCGQHMVRIGSAGTEKKVDVPCAASMNFTP